MRSCFEFLQKVFVLRQIARYLPHHRSKNASKTHPKSSHDKFKTASEKIERIHLLVYEIFNTFAVSLL